MSVSEHSRVKSNIIIGGCLIGSFDRGRQLQCSRVFDLVESGFDVGGSFSFVAVATSAAPLKERPDVELKST